MPDPYSSTYNQPLYAGDVVSPPASSGGQEDSLLTLAIERPGSFARKFIEFTYYLTLLNSFFMGETGLGTIRFAGGGLVVLGGVLAAIFALFQAERIPVSIWFALLINVMATISQIFHGQPPILGEGLTGYALWVANLFMVCYIVQNDGAHRRLAFFLAILLIVLVSSGGTAHGTETDRLALDELSDGALGNANRLGNTSGLFAVVLLFWSFRSTKLLRPVAWGLAILLIGIVIFTMSRSAILNTACGLALVSATILVARGTRLTGIILIFVVLLAASRLTSLVADSTHGIERRFHERSIRLRVYSIGTLRDLANTAVFGHGVGKGDQTAAGIEAHNSFLYTHMVFGGMTAWPYLIWQFVLGWRVWRAFMAKDYPMDIRFYIVAVFGMSLGLQLLSNLGYVGIACLFATAVTEKYTAAYSRRRMLELAHLQQHAAYTAQNPHLHTTGGYATAPISWQ